jgi:cyclopropane fatty-acyl-phospholipid synthase-like methyltransferase
MTNPEKAVMSSEREDFELHMKMKYPSMATDQLDRFTDDTGRMGWQKIGDYKNSWVDAYWMGWQASRSAPAVKDALPGEFSDSQKMEALTEAICTMNAIAARHRMSADTLRHNQGNFSNATPENIAVYQSNADAIYRHVDALYEMAAELKEAQV